MKQHQKIVEREQEGKSTNLGLDLEFGGLGHCRQHVSARKEKKCTYRRIQNGEEKKRNDERATFLYA